MHITIDEDDARPVYQQVVDEIKHLIATGELREEAQLPPVRQIAADLGVNFNTIAAAYRELQREGLIAIRHGAGAVVASSRMQRQGSAQLRPALRAALTQLVLAGHPRAHVMRMVEQELRELTRETK